ncbi:MAG: 16S rRNA (cytidine(1402)-2'-O)-methyltransferase [Candidatus Sericytochromatia bacterium]|nr:16S rRNA (cytidine(1402)-2'-O)-methyltransferase [Candidatus Sericytochromatia bacterium]
MSTAATSGTLYVIATPIGNMGDITARALSLLSQVDLIAAEDTRETLKLLRHHNITTPLISHHAHNERNSTPGVIKRLLAGDNVAIVSDAGTPAISDPGEKLVSAAISAGVTVVPIPGATAFVAALIASGLPTGRFVFEGFLPSEAKLRRRALRALAKETRTMIFYEAPHRLFDTLTDMQALLGPQRPACIAREITKRFETFHRGTLDELGREFQNTEVLGELVLIIRGAEPADSTQDGGSLPSWEEALDVLLAAGTKASIAAREIALRYDLSREIVYGHAVSRREKRTGKTE